MTVPSSSVLAFTTLLRVRRSRWSFRGCRVHSELKPWLILRPASWLALLSRTFTFELSLAGSPRTSVEYNYVGKQSISHGRTFTGKSNGIMGCGNRSDPEASRGL